MLNQIRKNIIDIITASKGYLVEEKELIKNGISKNAIIVRKDEDAILGATIYIDEFISERLERNLSPEKILADLIEILDKAVNVRPTFDIDNIFSFENIKENARVGVQRIQPPYDEVKRPTDFKGIEEYAFLEVYDTVIGSGKIRLNKDHLKMVGISAEEVFKMGYENNHKVVDWFSMRKYLGIPQEIIEYLNLPPMFVLTNKERFEGAAAILDKKAITELSKKTGIYKWTVIPASRHEIIMLPTVDGSDLDTVREIVKMVNAESVSPEDVLADDAFEITVDADYMRDAA